MSKKVITSVQLVSLALVAGLLIWVEPVSAYFASEYRSQANLVVGSVVALDDSGELSLASTETAGYAGVVAARNDDVVEVATSGTVPMLVSDTEGAIVEGTRLGLSNISGVATASGDHDTSIAVATDSPANWRDYPGEAGGGGAIRVGTVAVRLVDRQPASSATGNSYMGALQRVASNVAGRDVDAWRAVIALLIAVGGAVIALVLLMSSSRSSFLSLGRNPMAGSAIMKGLWKVAAVAVAILIVSLGVAYAIVRSG